MATVLDEIRDISDVGLYGSNTWVVKEEAADAVPEEIFSGERDGRQRTVATALLVHRAILTFAIYARPTALVLAVLDVATEL